MTDRDLLAVVLHDAMCGDLTCEPQVFSAELKRADAILASDWLAAHDAALLERVEAAEALAAKVADAGERIAQAIEDYLNPEDCGDDPACEQCALVRQLATVARAALTEGTEA